MMKIGITGGTGRMGRQLIQDVLDNHLCKLTGVTSKSAAGEDVGSLLGHAATGIIIHQDLEKLVRESDAIIDFSAPINTLACARLAAEMGKIHVIGTTGMNEDQQAQIKSYASRTAIVYSANMSIGVNLLVGLVEQAARILGTDYDIEIVEMHHKHKVDSPSGTALALGEAAAKGRGIALKTASILSREGVIGARPEGKIGFATLRGGDVIGDHTVIFAGEGERIEISHKASSRHIYVKGAIRAALWAKGQKPGLYSMKDVLGL